MRGCDSNARIPTQPDSESPHRGLQVSSSLINLRIENFRIAMNRDCVLLPGFL
jgi:hypothetical protein